MKKQFRQEENMGKELDFAKFNGAPCAYFDGIYDYFNLNGQAYHAKVPGMTWKGPCTSIRYVADPAGSMESYRFLLGLMTTERKIAIVLYSGTWDSVVPFGNTLKGINELNLKPVYT